MSEWTDTDAIRVAKIAVRQWAAHREYEDLCQQATLAAILEARKPGWNEPAAAAYTAARRAVLEYLYPQRAMINGKRVRQARVPDESLEVLKAAQEWEPAIPDFTPQVLERVWLAALIRQECTPAQRAVLELMLRQDLAPIEVAGVLGMSPDRVCKRLQAARKWLRAAIKED